MKITKELRIKILYYMRLKNKNIRQLAKDIHLHYDVLGKKLSGIMNLTTNNLLKIAKALEVNPKYLFAFFEFKDGNPINMDEKRMKKARIPLKYVNEKEYHKAINEANKNKNKKNAKKYSTKCKISLDK